MNSANAESRATATAVLGGGCFWCTEAIFERLEGVADVVSGYAGGGAECPTYEEVSTGRSGFVEVIKIEYDPGQITFRDLLTVFFHLHDPTTPNQQGNDRGPQYRSVVFFESPQQQSEAQSVIAEIESQKLWRNPIVTTIEPLTKFCPAEEYHQDYFNANQQQPYCALVIAPKIRKLQKEFGHRMKKQ